MPDYSKGKIYKVWSPSAGLTYIGSTCQPLAVRLAGHRKNKRSYDKGKRGFTTSFQIVGLEDCRIDLNHLIEEYPCDNKMRLNKREGEIILSTECINKNVAGRGPVESYRAHYEKHKDKIEGRRRVKTSCPYCASIIQKRELKNHQKTQKCKRHQ